MKVVVVVVESTKYYSLRRFVGGFLGEGEDDCDGVMRIEWGEWERLKRLNKLKMSFRSAMCTSG